MTGDINHDVDVSDGETIVGIKEESDYGEYFLCIKRFIRTLEKDFYVGELAKKNIY